MSARSTSHPGTSEIDAAGLTALPGVSIPVPREAAASLECRHYQTLQVSPERRLCVGEVVYLHARAGIVDPARMGPLSEFDLDVGDGSIASLRP